MKKIIGLFIVVVILASCENDVSFNTPAFQARKDNFMWRANDYSAIYSASDSTLTLSAFKGFEVLSITAYPVIIVGNENGAFFQDATFDLRNNLDVTAVYTYINNGQTLVYSTDVEDASTGELVLQNGAIQKPGTISGLFRFDAPYVGEIPNAPERINFQEGVFYEIPITFAPAL